MFDTTLTFPAAFDPFTATDAETADLVRRLWTAPERLTAEYDEWAEGVDLMADCPW